ncbi:MAG: ABC transporter ATP-binding protein [Planctomycetota bacterium]
MTGSPAIRLRGIVRAFGAIRAVANLDLDVARGELFALVGPDGAGKSTTLRILTGLLRPDAGDGTILGHDIRREAAAVKRRIGYLSQAFTLYGDLSVDENLEFFAELHGVKNFHDRRKRLLEATHLAEFRDRLAGNLSGGMKKKLALASALVHTPDLILLDEPTTGVDPVSRGEFWDLLSGILEEGITVLLTTPYLDEAARCHRIGLMHRGRVMLAGTPEEIVAAMPGRMHDIRCARPAEAAQELQTDYPPARLVPRGEVLRLWSPDGSGEPDRMIRRLEASGRGPAEARESEASLEDAFVALLTHAADIPGES